MRPTQHAEPQSAQEAEARLSELYVQILDIEGQLKNPNVMDANGQRLGGRAWLEWRHRAVLARSHKTTEYRFLKAWLKSYRANTNEQHELGESLMWQAERVVTLGLKSLPEGDLRAAVVDLEMALNEWRDARPEIVERP